MELNFNMDTTKDFEHDLKAKIIDIASAAELITRKLEANPEMALRMANRIMTECNNITEELELLFKERNGDK